MSFPFDCTGIQLRGVALSDEFGRDIMSLIREMGERTISLLLWAVNGDRWTHSWDKRIQKWEQPTQESKEAIVRQIIEFSQRDLMTQCIQRALDNWLWMLKSRRKEFRTNLAERILDAEAAASDFDLGCLEALRIMKYLTLILDCKWVSPC